jgi:hypothetical protein
MQGSGAGVKRVGERLLDKESGAVLSLSSASGAIHWRSYLYPAWKTQSQVSGLPDCSAIGGHKRM